MPRQDLIKLRRDTSANWTSTNPILADGEKGIETDTNKEKVGDGSTDWNSRPYHNVSAGSQTLQQVTDQGATTTTFSTFSSGVGLGSSSTITADAAEAVMSHPINVGIEKGGQITTILSTEGNWNASTNSPALSNTDTNRQGVELKVTVAGTQDFGAGDIRFSVGDIVANDGSVWYKKVNNNQIITAVKTADETKNNDNTVTLDSELQITLEANSYYDIEIQLLYEAGGTPDLRTQFEVPTGSGGSFWRTNNTSNVNSNNLTSIISNLGLGVGTSTHTRMRVNIYTDTTSGIFGVKWSQNTSHPDDTTIYRGSSIKAVKLN